MNKTRTLVAMAGFSLIATATNSGCASKRSRPLPEFDTVAITTTIRPADGVKAKGDSDTARAGAEVGAKGGAAAGAAYSLLCGPFVVICLPFFATTGAVIGGTAGSVAGSLGDAVDNLPRHQAKRARAILEDIDERPDILEEMRDGVTEKVPADRQRPDAD
ncbi:MAG: hypothetical protein JSW21_01425, partial [Gammaproteobacteria bacterium]